MLKISAVVGAIGGLLVLVVGARTAHAVDTLEPFDIGCTNIDFYVGVNGMNRSPENAELFGETMLGAGIVPGLSWYVGAGLAGNGYLAQGGAGLYLGLYATPIDTHHFDLDVIFDVSGGDAGFSTFALTPGLELNLDSDDDMSGVGLFLLLSETMSGEATVDESAPPPPPGEEPKYEHRRLFETGATIGGYWSATDAAQLLVQFDAALNHSAQGDERSLTVGAVALGLNCTVHDSLELINELSFDIPQDDEKLDVGFMTGFIATLPSAGE